jgi:hypothetical protein
MEKRGVENFWRSPKVSKVRKTLQRRNLSYISVSAASRRGPRFLPGHIAAQGPVRESRVGKGISAQASHRTVREALTSYGSCYPINLLSLIANDRTCLHVEPVFPYT